MIKTKIKRIEELNDKYLILNEKEMKFLRKCLKSRKQDVDGSRNSGWLVHAGE